MQRTKKRCRGRREGVEDEERVQMAKRGCRGQRLMKEEEDDEDRHREIGRHKGKSG